MNSAGLRSCAAAHLPNVVRLGQEEAVALLLGANLLFLQGVDGVLHTALLRPGLLRPQHVMQILVVDVAVICYCTIFQDLIHLNTFI